MSERSTPAYLVREYLDDYGWDNTDFGADRATLERYHEAELIHARWAMLGTLGCLTPEILAKYSGVHFDEPVWFQVGAEISQEGGLNYFGNPSRIHAKSILTILACHVLVIGAIESYRANYAGLAIDYLYLLRGEAFQPLGLADHPDTFAELKVKEIKNDRFAMCSMLCYFAQTIVTGEGPIENWATHVAADTFGTNDMSLTLMGQVVPSPPAMFAACGNVSDNLIAGYGPKHNKWSRPSPDASDPAYLTGEHIDGYGWDNADLGVAPTTLQRYREGELIHARWAMLGTLGCLTLEILVKYSGVHFDELVWFLVLRSPKRVVSTTLVTLP